MKRPKYLIIYITLLLFLIRGSTSEVDQEALDDHATEPINPEAGSETGCLINQRTCIKHPTFVGSFRDKYGEEHNNASTIEKNCFDSNRAEHFHKWCCNPENETTSAIFLYSKNFFNFPKINTEADQKWSVPIIGEPLKGIQARIEAAVLQTSDAVKDAESAQVGSEKSRNTINGLIDSMLIDNVVAEASKNTAQEQLTSAKETRAQAQSALSTILTLMANIDRQRQFSKEALERNKLADTRRMVRVKANFKFLLDKLREAEHNFKNSLEGRLLKNRQSADLAKKKHLARLDKINTDLNEDLFKTAEALKGLRTHEMESIKSLNEESDRKERDIRLSIRNLEEKISDLGKKELAKMTSLEKQVRQDAVDATEKEKERSHTVISQAITDSSNEVMTQDSLNEKLEAQEKLGDSKILMNVYKRGDQIERNRDQLLAAIEKRYNDLLLSGRSSLNAFSIAMNEQLKDSMKTYHKHNIQEMDAFINNRKEFINEYNNYNNYISTLHCDHFSKVCNMINKLKNHVNKELKCSDPYCSDVAVSNSVVNSNGLNADPEFGNPPSYKRDGLYKN